MIPDKIIFPEPLKDGDKIAICSPAGIIDPKHVDGAVKVLDGQGWIPVVMPHALGKKGNYSGTAAERFYDLKKAFEDAEIRAILCSRGGYGVVHIMEDLAKLPLSEDPKWVIGFSDISALHAMMLSKGVASIHASMTKQVALGPEDEDNRSLFGILRGNRPFYTFKSDRLNRPGQTEGRLSGGNLAVLAELINTPYDILLADSILFIEDVSEPIYKVERILYQLKLSGVLANLKGLIVGQFTEYKSDANYKTMEKMISDMVYSYKYPVAFNVPIGHVDHNLPMIEGARITLKVTPSDHTHIIYWK